MLRVMTLVVLCALFTLSSQFSAASTSSQPPTIFTPTKITELYAWVIRAFAGDPAYNDLMLAFAALFSPRPPAHAVSLLESALEALPSDSDAPLGEPYSLMERESGSLGAMGAGQWTGQFRTRPHALLDVRQFSTVDEYTKSLSRGARRTLARSYAQNFTVTSKTILGNEPAPHSSLAHFRCVVEHEVRLLSPNSGSLDDDLLQALAEAINRFNNCVSQAGELREYRDSNTGEIIAFAQEAAKGRVSRGQWFYASDAAAKQYVWFHSVQEIVGRSIENPDIDVVDLGPSGTDAFSELKAKYGFASVNDWHTVADYRGRFKYENGDEGPSWKQLDPPDWLFEKKRGPFGIF
ncbi:hypothetical protein TrST_g14137 [Triparma strigata]|uniref:Uncharacterized protein n=1 Tax=Triparma strigata TaxID=1606541 RepID=A0A9W7ACU7_9STRA|nr:hypothetical protein TrST_g14137 [Triparma strigata]